MNKLYNLLFGAVYRKQLKALEFTKKTITSNNFPSTKEELRDLEELQEALQDMSKATSENFTKSYWEVVYWKNRLSDHENNALGKWFIKKFIEFEEWEQKQNEEIKLHCEEILNEIEDVIKNSEDFFSPHFTKRQKTDS